jgi:hypothetical protein
MYTQLFEALNDLDVNHPAHIHSGQPDHYQREAVEPGKCHFGVKWLIYTYSCMLSDDLFSSADVITDVDHHMVSSSAASADLTWLGMDLDISDSVTQSWISLMCYLRMPPAPWIKTLIPMMTLTHRSFILPWCPP